VGFEPNGLLITNQSAFSTALLAEIPLSVERLNGKEVVRIDIQLVQLIGNS
jgi:hypothetical protein